jgi:hypothetical protein
LFGTARATIPQININLYSEPGIIVFKMQKDLSTRTYVITQKQFCLLMNDDRKFLCSKKMSGFFI